MIRVLVLLLCSSFFYSANAQVLTKPNWYGLELARGQINTWLRIPSDTTANKEGIARIGTTIYAGNGTYWTAASGGGGSSLTLPEVTANGSDFATDSYIDMSGNDYTVDSVGGFVVNALNTKIGRAHSVTGDYAIAIGGGHTVSGEYGAAIGRDNIVSGEDAASIGGQGNTASGTQSVTLGGGNNIAGGLNSVAIGQNNVVDGQLGIAMGDRDTIDVSINNGIAIGTDLRVSNDNQIKIGTRDYATININALSKEITLDSATVFIPKYPDTLTSNFSQIGRDITTGKIGVIAGGGGGSGTVTSVATGYGLSGGTITTSGTLLVDSATLSTKYLRITDTANMRVRLVAGTNITNISGTYPNLTINAATQTTDTTSLSSRINLKANIASPTFTGTPILPTGTIATTQSAGNNSTAIATTAYADAADNTKWSLASGGTLTGTNTITAGSNPLIISTSVTTGTGATAGHQIVANSLTTGRAVDYSSSSITTGNILKLTSTSTAANAFSLLNINSSGANANSTRTATGQTISVTNTGTTSTNVGLSVTASGATNNYAALFTGNVGIGTSTPDALLKIQSSSSEANLTLNTSASSDAIRFQFNGTNKWGLLTEIPNTGNFVIYDYAASAYAETFVTGGKIGIYQSTPTSMLHVGGSFAAGYVAKTANYTATINDYTIECTANTFQVTLPTAVGITGRIYNIVNSGAGTITVGTTSSQTFVNVTATPTTLTMATVGSVMVQSNGANWMQLK